jgi:hypothetical protein
MNAGAGDLPHAGDGRNPNKNRHELILRPQKGAAIKRRSDGIRSKHGARAARAIWLEPLLISRVVPADGSVWIDVGWQWRFLMPIILWLLGVPLVVVIALMVTHVI